MSNQKPQKRNRNTKKKTENIWQEERTKERRVKTERKQKKINNKLRVKMLLMVKKWQKQYDQISTITTTTTTATNK